MHRTRLHSIGISMPHKATDVDDFETSILRQEICAKLGNQLHEHMRVPRPSLGGNLGIDPPPANLQV